MLSLVAQQDRRQLLSFVVVGGGPTGVEVAAELQDMVESDLVKVYPELIRDVRIAVIELQDHVLSTYDRRISEYTRQIFTRCGLAVNISNKLVPCLAMNKVVHTSSFLLRRLRMRA